MASTYSTNLRLELIGTGEQQGTWGATTNTNLGTLLEEAICGYISVPVTNGVDTVLTTNNGAADQSRNMVLNLTGALTAVRTVLCPAIEKLYVVKNSTTGGYAVTFKVSGQTGVSIPNGETVFVYVNGTDVVAINGTIASQNANNVSITGGSITGITDLAVADGGTGSSTASGARTNLGLGTIATQNSNSVSITGGSITGITDIAVADGGTGASTASAARTNLGIGTIATQDSNNVSITGGSITGITDIAVADGGTGASTASAARTNLGIGTIATQDSNNVSITGGSVTGITDIAVADGGTGSSTASGARTNLGLGNSAILDEATAAQYRDNTADKVLTTDQVWSAVGRVALTWTSGGTTAVDFSSGLNFTVTTSSGNSTLGAPTNAKTGQSGFIEITQDAATPRTLAYASAWVFDGGTDPTLTATASAKDVLYYTVLNSTGPVVHGTLRKNVS